MAQKAFTDGTGLFREDNYRSAIEKYREALSRYTIGQCGGWKKQ